MKRRLLFALILAFTVLIGFGQSGKKIVYPFDEQTQLNPNTGFISSSTRDIGDPVSIVDAMLNGADYLVNAQADVTEDNAGNGSSDTDPDDAGFDWVSAVIPHSSVASPKNLYGVTVTGIYYAYLNDPDPSYLTAMQDAATVMIADADIRSSSDLVFLMQFQDIPGVTANIYKDAAKAKFDARIALYGSATALAQYLRDMRHGQGYDNGVIPWDIGGWAVAAQMLEDRYPSDPYDYALAADDIAEVIYQDTYAGLPGYFDLEDNAGWDPTYANTDFYWYSIGITGIIDAFKYANVHTAEIPALKAILEDCQYPGGAFSFSYGANTNDEDWQSTAYVVKSLATIDQNANQVMINHACYWLAATQDGTTGAWIYSNGDHYPEVGGEITTALYFGENAEDVYVDNDYTSVSCGGHLWGYDAFNKIQDGIDAVAAGGTVHVYAGDYGIETAANRQIFGTGASYNFGLFINKNNLTVKGYNAAGNPVSSASEAAVIFQTGSNANFGPSGIFVEGNNVTLEGLKIGDNIVGGNVSSNKTLEIIGDGFTMNKCFINTSEDQGAFYLGVWDNPTAHPISTYTITDNIFHNALVSINNGAGVSGPRTGRVITGNTFTGVIYPYVIGFRGWNGGSPAQGWILYPVGGAVITGNVFNNTAMEKYFVARGNAGGYNNGELIWSDIWNLNTYGNHVVTLVNESTFDVRSYNDGTYAETRAIYPVIQAHINMAQAGDKVNVSSGIYTEQLYVTTNNISIEGAGKTSTIVKSPVTLPLFFNNGSNDNHPIVFVEGVASFSMKNLTIDGDGKGNGNYRFMGIAFYNAGGNVQNVDVKKIWETPFTGNQHGNGVYSFSNAGGPYTITLKNMLIEDYQKNGMALLGNVVLDLDNITTKGEGATAITAQNGIQVGPLTTGLIKNCNVQDVQYTGASWTASGIILDGDVNVENTTITGCQTSIYSIDANNNLTNVNITAPLITVEEAYGVIAYSTVAAKSNIGILEPSRFDEGENGGNRAASMTLNMTNCRLTGNDYAGSIGVYLYSENSLTANILKCKFNDWDYAIYAAEDGSGTITATVKKCNLGDNNWGIYYEPVIASRAPMDATENWWGDESGPSFGGKGTGSQVSGNVNYADWITDPVDIKITNPECGKLHVIAAPSMPLDGQVTNILFAVRWDALAYPGDFLTTVTDYNVNLQYYATDGAFRYAVFGTDLAYINWDALVGDTLVHITLDQSSPEGTVSDFVIADDAWTAANNADYYFEFWGTDLTGLITGFADDVYLGDCDLMLHAKVFLQGSYNSTTNLMNVDLTTNGPIPLAQPYGVAPWSYTGTETLATIPADMIDWVLVELRSTPSGAPIRQAGLLFKDGTIRSAVPPHGDIYYTGAFMPNSDYYVAVFHRNHMPVMSSYAVNIPNPLLPVSTLLDLTDLDNGYKPNIPDPNPLIFLETGVHGMIAGDVNKDGDLLYSGAANDRGLILAKIADVSGNDYINSVIQGYYVEDLTMNSWVKYSGSGNDQRLIILNLIELTGTYALNASYASLVPGWGAKALHVAPGTGPLDIALVENDNTLDVVLYTKKNIPESYTDNIQFTLSWDENNVMMDQAVYNFTSNFKLAPQGEIMVDNGRKYMTFVVVDWIALPAPFNTGENVTVLSLNKGSWSGVPSKATIAQDGFALRNNGGYYVSLVGKDMTGQVLETMTGIDNPDFVAASLKLYPNPATQGFVTMSFIPSVDETLTITVTDLSSRIVSMQQAKVIKGQPVVKQISLDGLSKGIYFVRLQGIQTFKTGKVEIQ